ncbi:MAG: SusC/RagA family TonB-linked outer membrane protein, partial [Bacteroidales bacterium]|nr:SusC/RagA family TonB-linked outer membrane protein [Bacteroidales bacterium]
QGTVLDENNEPVIGASVSQKGTKGNAVATDAFGNFKIRVAAGTPLEVSYVGYKNETVAAANGMTVYMQPTTEMLNELVAIGYGTQKRANLTGAVATVDVARTMDARPQTDVAKALQGAVPGLTITTNNGDITSSGNAKMRIRGTGTLSNSQTSSPLIVVDGVPVDDLSFVNPDDIAEISVLKDASSSAIYGTRAAFGVILITTKTPNKQDKVSVKYTNNFGWSGPTTLPQYADVPTQLRSMIQQQKRAGGDTELFGMHFTNLLPYAEQWQAANGKAIDKLGHVMTPYVDANNPGDYYIMDSGETLYYANWNVGKIWYNDAAPSNKHDVSLEGVSGKTNYRASFGYNKRTALENIRPGEMRRYNANVNVNTQIFDWLRAGVRFTYSSKEYSGPNGITGQATPTYLWRWGSYFNPFGLREYDGKEYYYKIVAGRMDAGEYKDWASDTKIQAYMDANIIKGLSLHADYTYDIQYWNSETYYVPVYAWNNWSNSATSPTDISTTSGAGNSTSRSVLWTTNVYGTYEHTFANDYNLKVMLGGTAEQYTYTDFNASRETLLDVNLPYLGLTSGQNAQGIDVAPIVGNSKSHRATAGFFGRVNFDYKGIYLIEFNGRYDGSSRFPARQTWGFFPSGSIGYRFSEEQYFTDAKKYVSNGKVRASYGAIGNEAIGSNMFISTIAGPSNYYWLQNGGVNPTKYSDTPKLVSSSLTWERVETLDVGVDLGFFNNSLNLTFDWFQRDTKNMLAPGLTLPGIVGVSSSPSVNEGQLRTRGWELGLGYNHSFGDWDIYANFNIYDGQTKVVKYRNDNMQINQFYTGAELGAIWGLETDRYFTEADCKPGTFEIDWTDQPGGNLPSQVFLQSGKFVFGPGDVKFKDLNGDGVIDGGIHTEAEAKEHPEIWKDPNDFSKGWYGAGTEKNHGDLKKIGNELPRYEYSFRLGAAWKGFDIDAYFQGVGKRDYWSCSAFVMPLTRGADCTYANQESYNQIIYDDNNKVTGYIIDQNNTFPCLFPGSAATGKISNLGTGAFNFYPQTRYLQDMSYLRFKQLTVGYTLPVNITRKALIEKARLYFTTENLCMLHNGMKGTGIDPEIESSHNAMAGTKNEQFGRVTPMPRTFSFGVQINF